MKSMKKRFEFQCAKVDSRLCKKASFAKLHGNYF